MIPATLPIMILPLRYHSQELPRCHTGNAYSLFMSCRFAWMSPFSERELAAPPPPLILQDRVTPAFDLSTEKSSGARASFLQSPCARTGAQAPSPHAQHYAWSPLPPPTSQEIPPSNPDLVALGYLRGHLALHGQLASEIPNGLL